MNVRVSLRGVLFATPAPLILILNAGGPHKAGKQSYLKIASSRFITAGLAMTLMGTVASSCQSQPVRDMVCFQEKCVQVEIAQKPEELARGLQFREKLAPHTGMLFVFPRLALYSFWMKDTKIPLDLIWMDAVQQVVDIKKNVPPCVEDPCVVYTPNHEARYVLEINSGAADTLKIQRGDTAVFQFAQ